MIRSWLQSLANLFGSTGASEEEQAMHATTHGVEAPSGALDVEAVQGLIKGIVTTRADKIGCDDCFDQVDHFADLYLSGKDVANILPLVHDHLQRCPDCREEYDALLRALQAEN